MDEESSIEKLKRRLYSRNEKLVPKDKITPVSPVYSDVPTNWGDNPSFNYSVEEMTRKNNSFFNKFLLGSILFFVISLGVAAFIFFGGINMISSDNLDIKIIAPSSISSGEELLMSLSVVNGNRTDLEDANLFIEYPSGSQSVGDSGEIITRDKIPLGTIKSGGISDYTLRALLFGEKDSIKTFIFRVEYKVKGSNAVFSKEKTYDVLIGSAPMLLNIDYPKEINSGQNFTISIEVTSNSPIPLKNTLIKIEYPYGFNYKDSNIKPLRDNSVWNIGDLKNGDKKTLVLSGSLVGQNLEDRSFRISSGVDPENSRDFDTALSDSIITVGIRKSFFDLAINSPFGNTININSAVPVSINFKNTLPDKILNAKIEAYLSGNAYDRNKINADKGGFFQSIDNLVLWDKNTTANLTSLSPGDGGQVSLSVSPLNNPIEIRKIKNPHIDIRVVMSGDRVGTDSGKISSEENFTIKISSELVLLARSFRSTGPFANSGSIPPKADKETTYTITWTLTNTTNDLKNTTVSAVLPPGVSWKGETSPSQENIVFDPETNKVSWNVGNVSSWTGFNYSPEEVSFKVGIIPSVNQIGFSPVLLSNSEASALDIYTEKTIFVSAPQVTTRYSDSNFVLGSDVVAK